MIYVPFFNAEKMYPPDAPSLAHERVPLPSLPFPPLVAHVPPAPPSVAARADLPVVSNKIARAPVGPLFCMPRSVARSIAKISSSVPLIPTPRRADKAAFAPLYVAAPKSQPEPRPLSWASLIPPADDRPRLAPLPPYTPGPLAPRYVPRKSAPLPLVALLRERI